MYSGSDLTADPRPRLRVVPIDATRAEYVQDPKDDSRTFDFGGFLGGPIPRAPFYAYDADGKPANAGGEGPIEKDGFVLNGGSAARLYYDNPLAGEYQKYVGGTYHAMEFGTGVSPAKDLLDPAASEVKDRVISWVRVSKWLPWMKMGSRSGAVLFHTAGLRLDSWDEVPEELRDEVKANWATWLEAPPIDDPRPSMTSWDQFKRWREGSAKGEK